MEGYMDCRFTLESSEDIIDELVCGEAPWVESSRTTAAAIGQKDT